MSMRARDLRDTRAHYARLLRAHGDSPQAVAWRDAATQERRMAVLAEVGDLRAARVLDFGCGTGHLLTFLREQADFRGQYVGYDLSGEMIDVARRKFPGVQFEARDILESGVGADFDYVLINGVFNHRLDDNWGLMTAILEQLFPHVRRALAFNALSTYVDYAEPDLSYVNPERVFRFCKQRLSPLVTLRHDYLVKDGVVPFEFAVYAYQTTIGLRAELTA